MSERAEIAVGEKILIIEPLPYGRLKKVMKIVLEALGEFSQASKWSDFDFLKKLPEAIDSRIYDLVPLVFKQDFVTAEWIDENLTMIHMKEIVEKFLEVNRVNDFLPARGPVNPAPKERAIEPTPPPMS